MYVSNLSFRKITYYDHTRGRLFPFRGSSLCRSKPKTKKDKRIEKTEKTLSQLNRYWENLEFDSDEKGFNQLLEEIQGDSSTTKTDQISGTVPICRTKAFKTMSTRTKDKVYNKAFSFISTLDTTPNFLTLTFINDVEDKQAHKILNKFLVGLRKRYGLFDYLWVAERQDGKRNKYTNSTNNLHYHMLIDIRLDIPTTNALWVLCQYNSGIINHKADTRLRLDSLSEIDCGTTIQELYKKKQFKTIQSYLNPLQITALKSVKSTIGYLTKYITKNKGEFTSIVWHCSRGVAILPTSTMVENEVFDLACSPETNSYVNKQGKLILPKKHISFDTNGFDIAATVYLLKPEFFHKEHLKLMKHVANFFKMVSKKKSELNPVYEKLHDSVLEVYPHFHEMYGLEYTVKNDFISFQIEQLN
jgi:hypothetical protein